MHSAGMNVWRVRLPVNEVGFLPVTYLYLASTFRTFPPLRPATFGFGGTVEEAQRHAREGGLTAEEALAGAHQRLLVWDATQRLAGGRS